MRLRRRAFTLVELLVVISIIGILVAITSYAWASSSRRSRDNTRRADLERIRSLLGQYYVDYHQYPKFDTSQGAIFSATWQLTDSNCGSAHASGSSARISPKYTDAVPDDPNQKNRCDSLTDNRTRYLYLSTPADPSTGPATATGYALMANLEGTTYDYLTIP
ncbi:MAG TPA: prepilin-type N-terminal cleavage/methylation domain-containing protein, partial [Candidatus Saccharimonadales bacterium]|nr:prepilin-type N-terminal cleavage/methylation domain-containing protein [Candidatus Saccharimonadales bacterium]